MNNLPLPPGPRKKFFGDRLLSLQRDPLAYFERLQREYGDVVHFQIGAQHIVLVNQPDMIRDVLVTHNRNFVKGITLQRTKRFFGEGLLTSEGDYHLRQRRLMQPAFTRHQVADFAPVMVEYAARTRARWHHSQTVDLGQELESLTLAIAAKTLLNADVEGESQELAHAVHELMDLFNPLLLLMADVLEKLPLPPTRRLHRSKARIDATIYSIIDQHRAAGPQHDMLSMLMAAQDQEADGQSMTDLQLRDEALVILLAGYATVSDALTWTFWLLANNPDVELRFHQELDQVLDGRLPTATDADRLEYTRMIFSEAMRLYPPIWFLDRCAVDEFTLAGYRIPAGSTVIMSQWLVHHDPRYYPDPYRFDPLRWTGEVQAQNPKFAYFPFGSGPRLCIGEPFAWLEGVLLMATLGQHWRLKLLPNQNIVPMPGINLRPKPAPQVQLQARQEVAESVSATSRNRPVPI